MIDVNEVVDEYYRNRKKCEVLCVPYMGSDKTRKILADMIDSLPENLMQGIRIGYDEGIKGGGVSSKHLMSTLLWKVQNCDEILKSLKIEGVRDCDAVSFRLCLGTEKDTPGKVNDVITMGVQLYAIRQQGSSENVISMLRMYVGIFQKYYEQSMDATIGYFEKWVVGNEEVNKAINEKGKLYNELLVTINGSGMTGIERIDKPYSNWDAERKIVTQKYSEDIAWGGKLMLHIIASFMYGNLAVAMRVYSDVDKNFKDVGAEVLAKMYEDSAIKIRDMNKNYKNVGAVVPEELYREGTISIRDTDLSRLAVFELDDTVVNARTITRSVYDNLEAVKDAVRAKKRYKALVGIEEETVMIDKLAVSALRVVNYKGVEAKIITDDSLVDLTDEGTREKLVDKGFCPYYYISTRPDFKAVSGEITKDCEIGRIIKKENVLSVRNVEAVQLLDEIILLRYNNIALKKWRIPEGITMIDGGALAGCPNLEELEFNNKEIFINHRMFENTKVRQYEIKPNIKAFAHSRYSSNEADMIVDKAVARRIIII